MDCGKCEIPWKYIDGCFFFVDVSPLKIVFPIVSMEINIPMETNTGKNKQVISFREIWELGGWMIQSKRFKFSPLAAKGKGVQSLLILPPCDIHLWSSGYPWHDDTHFIPFSKTSIRFKPTNNLMAPSNYSILSMKKTAKDSTSYLPHFLHQESDCLELFKSFNCLVNRIVSRLGKLRIIS